MRPRYGSGFSGWSYAASWLQSRPCCGPSAIPGRRHPPEWDITYPTGIVRAAGYPDTPIDFGFPDI